MKKSYLFTILLAIVFISCEQYTDSITFVNKSDIDVFVFGTLVSQEDSILRYNRPAGGIVKAHSSNMDALIIHNNRWKNIFNRYGGTLSFFVLDAEVVEKYSWDSIRDNYVILKRYDYTEADMIANDWTIVYP